MKQMYLPTLSEMREMLGEDLYVRFVWMWREMEQDTRGHERREKLLRLPAAEKAPAFPTPLFTSAGPLADSSTGDAGEFALARLRKVAVALEEVRPRSAERVTAIRRQHAR